MQKCVLGHMRSACTPAQSDLDIHRLFTESLATTEWVV